MRCALSLLITAGAALTVMCATAQPEDRIASAECGAARDQLEAAFDDPAIGRAERAQRLAAARKKVLTLCLGPASAQPQRRGAPEPVIAVPAPIISVQPANRSAPAAAPTSLPALAIPRPAVITTCDPAGCWDGDGRRLNNLGPMLVGPRGPCTVQGGIANCP
jgi:hypothetical protein